MCAFIFHDTRNHQKNSETLSETPTQKGFPNPYGRGQKKTRDLKKQNIHFRSPNQRASGSAIGIFYLNDIPEKFATQKHLFPKKLKSERVSDSENPLSDLIF